MVAALNCVRLRKAELRCLPDLRTGPEQTWGACYNMSFTRELKNSDYKSPLLVLGFASRSSSKSSLSRSSFSYYLIAEKVRTTRRGVQCSGAGGKEFTIQFPLRFHSSIHVFASFYSDVSGIRRSSRQSCPIHRILFVGIVFGRVPVICLPVTTSLVGWLALGLAPRV